LPLSSNIHPFISVYINPLAEDNSEVLNVGIGPQEFNQKAMALLVLAMVKLL
jgi:hypothetical protein